MSEPRQQELEQQIQEYRKAVDKDPGSPLFVPLAQTYLAVNNPAEALEVCRSGLAFLPDLPAGRLVLSKVLCRLGRLREAEAELAALVALAPNLEEALELLAQLRTGSLVTLDIRPMKPLPLAPIPIEEDDSDEDEGMTRGLMRPVQSAGHPSGDILALEEEIEEFPAEKTVGQGIAVPISLRDGPSEEEVEGQETIQGRPLRRSGVFDPPKNATPPKNTGNFGAVFEDDDGEDDGDSTRPLIDMQQQSEAKLSWEERSKLIQEGQGGLADLFSAGPSKKEPKSKEPSKSKILTPEYRAALDSSPNVIKSASTNALKSGKDLATIELRKSAELKPPPLVLSDRKSAEIKHPSEENDLRKSGELKKSGDLKPMPNFRNSASFKAISKHDSKPSLAAAVKSALEIPPPEPSLDPPKRRTQVVPKANKTPMFSPLEEIKGGNAPKAAETPDPSVNAPLQPQQKFPTAPLVQAVKFKPVIEYIDSASPFEERKPTKQPTLQPQDFAKSPTGLPSPPKKSPSGSQQNGRVSPLGQPMNPPRSGGSGQVKPPPDFFATPPMASSPAWQERLISPAGLTPLGPQEVPILPPERKPPSAPWLLIGTVTAVLLAVLAAIFFFTERGKKRDEVTSLLGAVDGLVAEGNAAGLLSAEELLERAIKLDPEGDQVLSKIALVEGMRLLVLREERVERLGDALGRASANQFTDENISLGHIALTSQSNLKNALDEAQDARVKQPDSALLAFAEGFIQSELGQIDEAQTDFKTALSLSPGFSWAQLSLAEYYAFTNNPELTQLLEAELREHPSSIRALTLALLRSVHSKDIPNENDIKEQLRRAFKLSLGKREAEWVRLALARYFYLTGSDQDSEQYAEAFNRTPAQSPMVAILAAELFYAKGQHAAAKDNLVQASQLLPEVYWVGPLCEALLNTKRITEVEPVLAKVPQGAKSHYLRGRLLLLLKDSTRASAELNEAFKQDPTLSSAALFGMLSTLSNQDTNITTINGLVLQLSSLGIPAEPPRALPAPYPRALPLLVKNQLLKAQNKPDEAQKLVTQAMQISPKDEMVIQANNEQ